MPKCNAKREAKRERRRSRQQVRNQQFEFTENQQRPQTFKQKPPLEAKNEAQGHLISNILSKDVTLVVGPAGTGKTYVTSTLALEELQAGRIEKILITRPMQECEEDIGALPGELGEKYAPWVRPILDVFSEHLPKGALDYALKSGRIEFAPLQFMRGSSFKNCWVILDEAQNTTPNQMRMFLTRLGEGAKLIIDGDLDQVDLRDGRGNPLPNGLSDAWTRLRGIPEIGRVEFTRDDIVRHGLIRKILERY